MAKREAERVWPGYGREGQGWGMGGGGGVDAWLCQASPGGSWGCKVTKTGAGERGGGEGSWIGAQDQLSLPSLPLSLSAVPLPPLSLLHPPPPWTPAQAPSSFPGPSPTPTGLCPVPTGPQRDLSTLSVDPPPSLLTYLPWLPSTPGQSPSSLAWPPMVAHQSLQFHPSWPCP